MKKRISRGYTLIEAVMVMGIIAVFVGGGIANYRALNRRKQVEAAAKQIETVIRQAQKNASSGFKASGWCNGATDELRYYTVRLGTPQSNFYMVQAFCSIPDILVTESGFLANNIIVNSAVIFDFDLKGRASADRMVCIRDEADKYHYQIHVTKGGSISLEKTSGC